MKQLLLNIGLLIFAIGAFAQANIDYVLTEVEKNNQTLISFRNQVEASKLENKTGIYLQNPEVGVNYLWEDPYLSSNRIDFSVTQGFDFPSSYRYKNQIAGLKNEQLDMQFEKKRKAVMIEAKLVCYDIIYTNAILNELSRNLEFVSNYAVYAKRRFDAGEVNILEYNTAQLNLLNISNEVDMRELDRTALLSKLSILNGGNHIEYSDSTFIASVIPVDFDKWYKEASQSNPILKWLNQEVEISQKQAQLNRSMSLPKFQAGYMSEAVAGQSFRGVTMGMSVPLWENKNTVKQAKAYELAVESFAVQNKTQLYNELKRRHIAAIKLYTIVENYRTSLKKIDNTELLKKALNQGEISLVEYTFEITTYYDSYYRLIGLERDLNKMIAELYQYM